MNVIVVGGGKVGARVASLLLAAKHQVKVIEIEANKRTRLQREVASDAIVIGSGTEISVLESAGIRQAHVVAAVTGRDEVNLVVTSLARFAFETPRTIARVNNPKNAWMYTPQMGVDVAINQADLMAQLILGEMDVKVQK
ncbi:MAG: NAD-binding protein [Caldilineaceae bacterium]